MTFTKHSCVPSPINICQRYLTDNPNCGLYEREAPYSTYCLRAKWSLVKEDISVDGAMIWYQ